MSGELEDRLRAAREAHYDGFVLVKARDMSDMLDIYASAVRGTKNLYQENLALTEKLARDAAAIRVQALRDAIEAVEEASNYELVEDGVSRIVGRIEALIDCANAEVETTSAQTETSR